jgi:putative CRISPR-associated protein (TIGR02620 family)
MDMDTDEFFESQNLVLAMVNFINRHTRSGFTLEMPFSSSGNFAEDLHVYGGEGLRRGIAAIDFIAGALAAQKKYRNMGFSTHVDLVVTRHRGYLEYLEEKGFSWERVVVHAAPEEIDGRSVITSGLPLHLAQLCRHVITIPLTIPESLRGKELSSSDVQKFAGPPQWFKVLGGQFPHQDI